MDDSPEHLMSQALLEKLEPLIHTIESQLRDLGQGQVILQGNIAQLSSELNMTQAELDRVHDTFARLPHYIAKLAAMKNTIANVSVMSRKLKRRAEQVTIGREKQNNKAQAARAREQAYDQTIAAVRSEASRPAASASTQPQAHNSPGNSPQQALVDRFPQISAGTDDAIKAVGSSMEVEVVRLRRKKKAGSKSSASSVASTGTTGSKRGQSGKGAKPSPGTPRTSSPSQI
ncbi:hypothetical protein BGW39_005201 [Mortierella sp. 14UC]|nr:hypothetical protein BGW39_005201 [Mortierella sp. 14UC]